MNRMRRFFLSRITAIVPAAAALSIPVAMADTIAQSEIPTKPDEPRNTTRVVLIDPQHLNGAL